MPKHRHHYVKKPQWSVEKPQCDVFSIQKTPMRCGTTPTHCRIYTKDPNGMWYYPHALWNLYKRPQSDVVLPPRIVEFIQKTPMGCGTSSQNTTMGCGIPTTHCGICTIGCGPRQSEYIRTKTKLTKLLNTMQYNKISRK